MYQSLQAFRGLAALGVAAFHLSIVLGNPDFGGTGINPFWDIARTGSLGVDFFFVLSGFIILQAHTNDINQPNRVKHYILRRIIRIFPIYWLYLASVSIGMITISSSHFHLNTALDWLTAISLIRLTPVEVPLAQAWTLFHEILFYCTFALLVCNRAAGILTFLVWQLIVIHQLKYYPPEQQTFTTTLISAHNINFTLGMLSFWMARKLTPDRAVIAWIYLLSGALLFSATLKFQSIAHQYEWSRLGYGLSFSLLITGAVALENASPLRLPVAIRLIGDSSYSIYLLHEHCETYIVRGLIRIGWHQSNYHGITFLIVLLSTTAIGCMAYTKIEKRLMQLLRTHLQH